MTIKIGDEAPPFMLPDQDGKSVSLTDFTGKWLVLYFYPKDDTPGCTLEGIEFTAHEAAFTQRKAAVVGVSGDSAEKHCAFREKHKLSVRLLSDPGKRTMERYGAFKEKMLYGRTFLGIVRSTVLIDPQGKVAWHWPKATTKGHAEEVLKKLGELQG